MHSLGPVLLGPVPFLVQFPWARFPFWPGSLFGSFPLDPVPFFHPVPILIWSPFKSSGSLFGRLVPFSVGFPFWSGSFLF